MDDSQKPKYEYKVNPQHKIMIETEFRKLPNEILTEKALHELKFVACKPMVTMLGTKNPGFQIGNIILIQLISLFIIIILII